ncbi:MAG: hypothetical protein WAU30_10765 [Propionicimonas sp.]
MGLEQIRQACEVPQDLRVIQVVKEVDMLDEILIYAESLAAARAWRIFGSAITSEAIEFGICDPGRNLFAQVEVTRGGSLDMLLSNGFEFLSFENDWDEDGTVRPLVRLAFDVFLGFTAQRYELTSGWLKKHKYMRIDGLPIEGRYRPEPSARGPLLRSEGAGE